MRAKARRAAAPVVRGCQSGASPPSSDIAFLCDACGDRRPGWPVDRQEDLERVTVAVRALQGPDASSTPKRGAPGNGGHTEQRSHTPLPQAPIRRGELPASPGITAGEQHIIETMSGEPSRGLSSSGHGFHAPKQLLQPELTPSKHDPDVGEYDCVPQAGGNPENNNTEREWGTDKPSPPPPPPPQIATRLYQN